MNKYRSVEFLPYGLTTDYYDNEVTENGRRTAPTRTDEFRYRHAVKGGTE